MKRGVIATAGGVAVALLACAVLARLGRVQTVGYDSFWHVFIARQPGWGALWRESLNNTHPPLFYWLLRLSIALFGNSPLAYRAPSIVCAGLAIVLLSRLVCRLTANPWLAVAAAAAFGFSSGVLEAGLEVRQYGVFLACVIAGFSAYLEWLAAPAGRGIAWRARAAFAVAMSLAVLAHYAAFFVLGGMLATPALLWLSHRRWRGWLRRELRGRPFSDAAMFGVPLAASVAIWALHLRRYRNGLEHVAGFMYDPQLGSRLSFTLRNLRNLAVLFLPDLGWTPAAAVTAALVLACGLAVAMVLVRGSPRVAPFVLVLPMLVANAAAGLKDRYPFGGYLRHQLFYFPFLLAALFVSLEVARRRLLRRSVPRAAWVAAAAAMVAFSGWHAVAAYPRSSEPLAREQIDRFQRSFGTAPAVLVDQFNFILVFGRYHEWRWTMRWEDRSQEGTWQVWDVSREGRRFAVCREGVWQSDLTAPEVYRHAAACLARAGAGEVAVFRPQQPGIPHAWKPQDVPARARELAPAAGLDPVEVRVEGEDIYATLRRSTRAVASP